MPCPRVTSPEHTSTCSTFMSVRKQVVKSSEPNVDAGKESKLPLNQNHLSCLFKWKVKLDSGAYSIHISYVVPLLTERMCTLSIACLGPCSRMVVRGHQMCCTLKVLLCTLLINPLTLGRGMIICKHRKNVYNKYVSGIINKGTW